MEYGTHRHRNVSFSVGKRHCIMKSILNSSQLAWPTEAPGSTHRQETERHWPSSSKRRRREPRLICPAFERPSQAGGEPPKKATLLRGWRRPTARQKGTGCSNAQGDVATVMRKTTLRRTQPGRRRRRQAKPRTLVLVMTDGTGGVAVEQGDIVNTLASNGNVSLSSLSCADC